MKIRVIGNSILFTIEEKDIFDVDGLLNKYCISKSKYTILVNKEMLKNNIGLKNKDVIEIRMNPSRKVKPSTHYCKVMYEDDLILIVKKRSNQIIHDDQSDDALINDVAYTYPEHPFDIMPIHRLDKMTQGLVFFNKIPCFQAYFDKLLSEKKIHREYLAIVEGHMKQPVDCTKKIGKDRHMNNKYRISDTGKEAHTYFKPLKYRKGLTLVKCTLYTGRTHQIRVHLESLKHPIVSDMIYGTQHKSFKDMGLFAYSLTFYNPLYDEVMTVSNEEYNGLNIFKNF